MKKLSLLTKYLLAMEKREKEGRCPNCHRPFPHPNFKRSWGCPWCVPEHSTEYCNGTY
jgi:Zn finger protein HypA/HybF involved in hydrogenase expression